MKTTRTPTTDTAARSHLRVLEGGLASDATQEDEPVLARDLARLEEEMAAAALLWDLLEQEGLQVTFDEDPAGGPVRAHVTDDAGRFSRRLSLLHVVDPLHTDPFTGAAR